MIPVEQGGRATRATVRLTKRAIDQAKPLSKPYFVWDGELKGFGARIDPGWSVDLFGMQVEAQLAASAYQRTSDQGGVHSHARFSADAISIRAQGTDVYDAVIRIVSKGS